MKGLIKKFYTTPDRPFRDKSKSKDFNTKKLADNKNRNANLNESDVWVHFFYINRYDSRIIVPKRNKMMGWTLNFGNPYTYVLIMILIALVILSKYLI